MSDIREALQEAVEYLNGDHGQNSIGAGSILHRKMKAALSANGGEAEPVAGIVQVASTCFKQVLPWDEAKRQHAAILSASDSLGSPGAGAELIPLYPAPPSVAVPEAVTDSMVMRGAEWLHDHGLSIDGDPASATDQMQEIAEGLFSAMIAAAPQPDHIADAGKVAASDWAGWACHKAGKMPRLYGEKSIAEVNCDTENGERLIFLSATPSVPEEDAGKVAFVDGLGAQRLTAEECREGIEYIIHGDKIYWPLSDDDELRLIQAACGNGEFTYPQATPSVPENDNGVSSAYDSGYLDAMLYARVCCDRLDNPENTKDYRDCARFLDLIFKSEIDEAARLRTAGDEGECSQ